MILSTANIYRVNKHRNYSHSTQKVTSIKDSCFIWRCTRLVPGALMQHRILQIIFFTCAWYNNFSPIHLLFSLWVMHVQRPKPELTKINYLLWVAQYFGKYYTIDYPWPCISVSATWLVPPQPWQHRAAAFHTTSLLSSQCCWLWNWWHKLQPQISDSSLNHILVQCFLVCVLKQFSAVLPFFVCVSQISLYWVASHTPLLSSTAGEMEWSGTERELTLNYLLSSTGSVRQ